MFPETPIPQNTKVKGQHNFVKCVYLMPILYTCFLKWLLVFFPH